MWSSASVNAALQSVLASNANLLDLFIPPMTLTANSVQTILFSFQNFYGRPGSASFTISTFSSSSGPHIDFVFKEFPIFYAYEYISFTAEL